MKIGAFAERNNLSVDAVRHYMELGLLLPAKQGGHYQFGKRTQEDLDEVLRLKGMGFSLAEVATIFKFRRLSKHTPYQQDEYYRELYSRKLGSIENDLKLMASYRANLLAELEADNTARETRLGLNLNNLPVLGCHSCSRQLSLAEATVQDNQVVDGKLVCSCGQQYSIESGIVRTPLDSMPPGRDYGKYLRDYISLENAPFVDNISRGLEWLHSQVDFPSLSGKVLLELGTGIGFFLRYIYKDLPDDCLYIAVDHNLDKLKFLKQSLQLAGCKKNILFLCADFLHLPIQTSCADVLLDLMGSTSHCLTHPAFLLPATDRYVKEQADLYACYVVFRNFAHNGVIAEECRRNFTLPGIQESIASLGYRGVAEKELDTIEKGADFEDYFVEGERIYTYMYFGTR